MCVLRRFILYSLGRSTRESPRRFAEKVVVIEAHQKFTWEGEKEEIRRLGAVLLGNAVDVAL